MFTDLNPEQIAAVTEEGHVLLTACPGSGKTRVLIKKLAYEAGLLGPSTRKICIAVTFTVRAADEIYKRLGHLGIDHQKIWSGTLHSFCLEWIIRPYACYIPELAKGFSIADETFAREVIDGLRDEFGVGPYEDVITRFTRDGKSTSFDDRHRKLLAVYRDRLLQDKLIDFDQLLYYSYRVMQEYESIPRTLAGLFPVICVDEFQDTQDLLYAIICSIVKAGRGSTSLLMVGDTDQAIYASLGGIVKSVDEIQEELEGMNVTPLSLPGNYRSTQRIIDFYSNFQTQRIVIEARGELAKEVGLISFNSELAHHDIVPEITRLISFHLDRGGKESEICVLVPQWWLISSVSRNLRASLPDVNFDASGMSPMARHKENVWYKLSKLFLTTASPRLYHARHRWAGEVLDRLQIATGSTVVGNLSSEKSFLRMVNSIDSDKADGIDFLHECFDNFTHRAGIDLKLFPQLATDKKIYLDHLEGSLKGKDAAFPTDTASFKRFFRERDGVVINTCVGVKGEEFDTVIAFGLLHGFVPHWQEIFDKGFDEQTAAKKLLYVLASRARMNLHLIAETGRKTKKGFHQETSWALDGLSFTYDEVM